MIPKCIKQKQLEDRVDKLSTYSTEEVKIGTWIDGKPLYRKVFNFITDSETYKMKNVNIGVENIDMCFIGCMSAIIDSEDKNIYMVNTTRQISNTELAIGGHNWFRISSDRKHVNYIVSDLVASSQCYLELYYTKTTD